MKNLKKLKLTIVMLSLLALMGCENFRDNSAISIGGADGPTSIIIRENKDDSEIKEVDVTQNVVEVQTGDEWDILPEYIYPGDNPVEKAITEHVLSNNYRYEMKAAVEIPAFCIFMEEVDENDADIVKVYGNYWQFGYERIDNTLECISGGEAPGVMYVKKNGDEYVVDHFEKVRDGSYYTDDIKAICNGNKSLEDQYFNSSDAMTTSRIYNIKKYVEMYDLDIDSYHDYGWDAVMLSDYDFSDNLLEESTSATTDYKAAIMVDGKIYLYSPQPMPGEIDNSAIIGYTSSYTDIFPEKDGETNFNREIGMPYAKVEEGIAVLYENEWHLCMPK